MTGSRPSRAEHTTLASHGDDAASMAQAASVLRHTRAVCLTPWTRAALLLSATPGDPLAVHLLTGGHSLGAGGAPRPSDDALPPDSWSAGRAGGDSPLPPGAYGSPTLLEAALAAGAAQRAYAAALESIPQEHLAPFRAAAWSLSEVFTVLPPAASCYGRNRPCTGPSPGRGPPCPGQRGT